jgi:hypothetical protein
MNSVTPVLLKSMGRCQNFSLQLLAAPMSNRRPDRCLHRGWQAPFVDALAVSFPAFHQSGSFPIKRGSIYPAGLQIKFVDDDLHQRRSGDRKKQSQ